MTSRITGVKIASYVLLSAFAAACLLPFYSMLVSATHANAEIASKLLLWPGGELSANYRRLAASVNIWRGFANSVVLSVVPAAVDVYFAALAGYGFSKFRFRGRRFLFAFVLATLMIPGQLGMIGLYNVMNRMHMLDTYWPFLLTALSDAFGIFLMRQFADAVIPTELMESGRMDGCGELRMFHRLVLPLLMPAAATLSVFVFIGKWNDFLTPMILLFDTEKQTLPVMIAGIRSQFSSDFGAQYVGVSISVLPLLVFFPLVSRLMVSDLAAGAIKA